MPEHKQKTIEKTRSSGKGITITPKPIPTRYQTFTWRRLMVREDGNCSDRRLKENIVLIGTTSNGIQVYLFNYIWDSTTKHVGVIAQELLETDYAKLVYTHSDGFYRVDYKSLNMTFNGRLLPWAEKTAEKTRSSGITIASKPIPIRYQTFTWRRLMQVGGHGGS